MYHLGSTSCGFTHDSADQSSQCSQAQKLRNRIRVGVTNSRNVVNPDSHRDPGSNYPCSQP
ncbi:hypothetical protein KC19_1G123700 [Ceratodon purpureus]|uniref:Uncharacterized protein n=1 Tax=Ceratodon purpureus TaxID=3225 RepID=A0A8T0J7J9_CERPU|nr:hypothetical protein KC19_1G123700 [Ceratodon purpureus]